jgi:hypothetical protein
MSPVEPDVLKAAITAGCTAAMVAAAALAIRLRHVRRTPSPAQPGDSFGDRLTLTAGRVGGMLVGAYLAGLLTVGAGGRLMMRILAVTSPRQAQGRRTEADAVIGRASISGSFFLVVAIGVGAAALGLALYTTLRRWLPDRSLTAGLVGVAIGAGLLVRPVGLLTSANSDFTVVAPAGLAVMFCIATLVLFGATFGVLVDYLAPRWPRAGWNLRGVAAVLPFAVLLPVPPLFGAAMIGVLLGTLAPRLRPGTAHRHITRAGSDPAVGGAGRIAVLAGGAVGTISILVAAGQVLAL